MHQEVLQLFYFVVRLDLTKLALIDVYDGGQQLVPLF